MSLTEFQRNNKKFKDLIAKDDVIVVKNNKPFMIAMKPKNYIKENNNFNVGDAILAIRKH